MRVELLQKGSSRAFSYFCAFCNAMVNSTEQEERDYLEEIKEKLLLAIRRVDDRVKQFSAELRQSKQYIYEHQSGMDEADMVAAGPVDKPNGAYRRVRGGHETQADETPSISLFRTY